MASGIKISGAWKDLDSIWIKVGGVWKQTTPYLRVSGAWKQILTSGSGGGSASPCTIDGSLDATGITASITGPSRPVTVPSGNTGKLLFRNLSGAGSPSVRVASGSFVEITEESTLTWLDAQAITAKATGLFSSGEGVVFDIFDFDTDTYIDTVNILRT
jgi:hypothetical protein